MCLVIETSTSKTGQQRPDNSSDNNPDNSPDKRALMTTLSSRHYDMSSKNETASVRFMKLWREFDRNENGSLDRDETTQLVRKLLASHQRKLEKHYGIEHRKFEIGEKELSAFVDKLVEINSCSIKLEYYEQQLQEGYQKHAHIIIKMLDSLFKYWSISEVCCNVGAGIIALERVLTRCDAGCSLKVTPIEMIISSSESLQPSSM